jgi:hypothetical protein
MYCMLATMERLSSRSLQFAVAFILECALVVAALAIAVVINILIVVLGIND